jgi:Polysaccharide biosynthesis enzyme WcbI
MRLRRRRPLCVVYGNCQAEPLRALLDGSPEFTARFATEPIPAINELRRKLLKGDDSALRRLRETVSRASLVLTQRIQDDYHGLMLGTDQVLSHAPRRHRTLTFPASHHEGTFPYVGYVPVPGSATVASAPLIEYHDLRIMACAARGWTATQTEEWLSAYEAPADALRTIWAQADAALAANEKGLDVRISERVGAPGLRGRTFHTVDHPTVTLMCELAGAVHDALGLRWEAPADPVDELDWLIAPVDQATIRALDLNIEPRLEWVRRGIRYTPKELVVPHLRFYEERPDILDAGVSFHAERLRELALAN